MRVIARLVLVVALGMAAPDAARPEELRTPPPAPTQETVVRGTPPDLTGRWLAVGWIDISNGHVSTLPALWEIATRDGKPELTQRSVTLPPGIKAAVDQANEANRRWEPSGGDLATLAASWDSLAPDDTAHVAKATHEIAAHDGFDDSLKTEPRTRDASWVVRQRLDNDPRGAPVIRQVLIYAVLASADGGWTGNLDAATIAAAPFPIPIAVKGSFRLYRLPESRPGVLARLLGVFEGCGRGAR